MSVSLYYTAVRTRPLSAEEQAAVDGVLARYDANRFVGAGGESFVLERFSSSDEPDALIEWSVGLPSRDEATSVAALRYWLGLLTDLRRVLPDAQWRVHLDDWDVPWSEPRGYYLPEAGEEPPAPPPSDPEPRRPRRWWRPGSR